MENITAIIIPARYGSSRLEGKPLIEVAGKPIIQWVYEKAQQSKLADLIIVATDDNRIYNAVKAFGGNVEMTSTEHKCGSDRIKEVVMRHPEIAYIVNLQGDEPLIKPESIDEVAKNVKFDETADISTLIRKITPEQALIGANNKFMARFRKMEELAEKPLEEYSFGEYDKLWKQAKKAVDGKN